ncbi:PAAR domain-containing protein [Burkholderia contaminans]|uniref:PAAR domain-containing protein n=1 Tax=Burkholderia contaminans TaxID=488447 RepID=A0A1E3FP14_9BURK|nr:PAAR domain-containing protein [Burkholderia contaminans]MBH9688806.1 PAAR domain-containing protein [Burkholderia contaminans]MBK1900716.1 PAAR domain-containing protein [Burkholderia contaminans]MBK1908959.1 PAAR domain-containing protein [Burkholderia contaminans]MBK1926308.1 PAAR domain-containing protein [Burkholderia contaminans]MBK1931205.1 PAAR domain-containing protein [Burkholderia contaminans]
MNRPKCKGVFPIAEGGPNFDIDGMQVALHNMKTACGARLIAGGSMGSAGRFRNNELICGYGFLLALQLDECELVNRERDDLHREVARLQGSRLLQTQ